MHFGVRANHSREPPCTQATPSATCLVGTDRRWKPLLPNPVPWSKYFCLHCSCSGPTPSSLAFLPGPSAWDPPWAEGAPQWGKSLQEQGTEVNLALTFSPECSPFNFLLSQLSLVIFICLCHLLPGTFSLSESHAILLSTGHTLGSIHA